MPKWQPSSRPVNTGSVYRALMVKRLYTVRAAALPARTVCLVSIYDERAVNHGAGNGEGDGHRVGGVFASTVT